MTYNVIECRGNDLLLRYQYDRKHDESVLSTLNFLGFMEIFMCCHLKYLVLNTIIFITNNVNKCN